MKLKHRKGSDSSQHFVRKPFDSISDLKDVSALVKEYYNPSDCDCKGIANMLCNKYSNLEAAEVDLFIYNGAIQHGKHVVCKVLGEPIILDPTGDYAEYFNFSRLKHDIMPWVYTKSSNCDMYLSQNHIPFEFSEYDQSEPMEQFTSWDVLLLSGGPFYKGLRGLTVS